MAYRIDDPYNQGIGTPDLGNMNLGQVPVNNMQVAEVFNTPQSLMDIGAVKPGKVYGYNLTPQGEVLEDFRNSAFNMREKGPTSGANVQTQFNRMLGIPSSFKDVIENQEYIQDAINKGFLKEESDWENQKSFADPDNLQASLDEDEYDFSGIEGQTAMLGLPQLFGMVKAGMSKKQIMKKVLANQLKEEAAKKIGKKVKPIITGVLTGGAKAGAYPIGAGTPQHHQDVSQGGGYQAPNIRSAPKGVTTSSGMHGGKHYARGGRVSYFDGGLASLWLR